MIELTGALMLAITPWLLKVVTNGIKFLANLRYHPDARFILRFVLALLSVGVAVLHAMLACTEVPADAVAQFVDAIGVFAEALILWLSTTGLYMLGKK